MDIDIDMEIGIMYRACPICGKVHLMTVSEKCDECRRKIRQYKKMIRRGEIYW